MGSSSRVAQYVLGLAETASFATPELQPSGPLFCTATLRAKAANAQIRVARAVDRVKAPFVIDLSVLPRLSFHPLREAIQYPQLHSVVPANLLFILGLSATRFRTDRVNLCFDSFLKNIGIRT